MNIIKVAVLFVLFLVGLTAFSANEAETCSSSPVSFHNSLGKTELVIPGIEKVCMEDRGLGEVAIRKTLTLEQAGEVYSSSYYLILRDDGSITHINDSVFMMKDGNTVITADGIHLAGGGDELRFSLLGEDKKEVFAIGINWKTKTVTHYYENKTE